MKCCVGSKLTVFILFLTIATLFGTEPGKQNVLNPANDQMCEIASLEMLSYSRCDLMGRVKTLELLLKALLEQLCKKFFILSHRLNF
uniref:Uncharacterized protein n=1 Tax=Acrobeloides nanus TaxID=290746 RepID=A0A914C9S2_9BILA